MELLRRNTQRHTHTKTVVVVRVRGVVVVAIGGANVPRVVVPRAAAQHARTALSSAGPFAPAAEQSANLSRGLDRKRIASVVEDRELGYEREKLSQQVQLRVRVVERVPSALALIAPRPADMPAETQRGLFQVFSQTVSDVLGKLRGGRKEPP